MQQLLPKGIPFATPPRSPQHRRRIPPLDGYGQPLQEVLLASWFSSHPMETSPNVILLFKAISILMLYMAATLLAVLGLQEVQYKAISVTLHTSTPFGVIHGSHRLLAACFQLRLYIPSILHGLQVTWFCSKCVPPWLPVQVAWADTGHYTWMGKCFCIYTVHICTLESFRSYSIYRLEGDHVQQSLERIQQN